MAAMPSLPFVQERELGTFQFPRTHDDRSAFLQQMELDKPDLEQPE